MRLDLTIRQPSPSFLRANSQRGGTELTNCFGINLQISKALLVLLREVIFSCNSQRNRFSSCKSQEKLPPITPITGSP